jgi:hypothetical protein
MKKFLLGLCVGLLAIVAWLNVSGLCQEGASDGNV